MMTALIKDPVLALSYGPSGIGKTTDTGLSFPNALFIAAPGALQSVKNVAGYSPLVEHATTIPDVTKLINTIASYRAKGQDTKIDAIVADDFSYLAEQTFALLEKKFNGFRLWGELRDAIIDFRNAARFAKVHIIVNCWEQPPKDKMGGGRVKGGPMLSGNLPEQVPAMFDMVLRCGQDPMRKPWQGIYQCTLDPNYIMKDRLNIASAAHPAPMNMAELIRAAGYEISRLPALPWQEEIVAKVSAQMVAEGPNRDKDIANAVFSDLIKNSVSPAHARWTLRDAMDRTVIRRALSARDSVFL
jgi:AAA domain